MTDSMKCAYQCACANFRGTGHCLYFSCWVSITIQVAYRAFPHEIEFPLSPKNGLKPPIFRLVVNSFHVEMLYLRQIKRHQFKNWLAAYLKAQYKRLIAFQKDGVKPGHFAWAKVVRKSPVAHYAAMVYYYLYGRD